MTFQRKLLFGALLMLLPVLLIGVEAIRTNVLERRALETLGAGLGRNRTYAELEDAMFHQSEMIWRSLTGLDADARQEFQMSSEVVDYWFDRWKGELRPDEAGLAEGVHVIQSQILALADTIFRLEDAGKRELAYRMAYRELKGRLQPALAQVNRDIYRRAREYSVQHAFTGVEQLVERERVVLLVILLLALGGALAISWKLTRGLVTPLNELRRAMAVVGKGDLDHPVQVASRDEIGELAQTFAGMTADLRRSRAEMVRLNAELEGKVTQLEQAQAQLVQSEKLASIGEMAAAVAHGLRNPLASLRAAAQFAGQHPGSPDAREHLTAIVDEVDRLDRRIAHLLTFSRPSAFHPIRERVAQLVESPLRTFQELLRERHVTLDLDLPATLPEVLVDPMKLEQVLVEIISNALDAMPGGGRLRVRAGEAALEGRPGIEIEISDTGPGIPNQVLSRVCEPFFTTRPEGTGLGLAIAKRFIDQHGGRLDLFSPVGEGAHARIWLPLPAAESALVGAISTPLAGPS